MNPETEARRIAMDQIKTPEPLFSCSNQYCAQETSYPADMLYWYEHEERWVCENCWDNLNEEPKRGIRLDHHLETIEKTRLAGLLACANAWRIEYKLLKLREAISEKERCIANANREQSLDGWLSDWNSAINSCNDEIDKLSNDIEALAKLDQPKEVMKS